MSRDIQPNKVLHLTAMPLRSIAAREFGSLVVLYR